MTKSAYKKGAIRYPFAALPLEVLRSTEWQKLPNSAKGLAMDLVGQYTGKNNGRLCVSFVAMQKCGWASKSTLVNAKRALLECSFVICARKGHPPRTAEWMAFTWWHLDYERSMDVEPKSFPYLNFLKLEISQIRAPLRR